MKHLRVPPSRIVVPEVRVTARFNEDELEQFKESIKEAGIQAPLICVEVDGQIVLVDGLHRLMEAVQNNLEYVDVVITPGTMRDVLLKNIYVDHLRGKTPVSEMRRVLEVLYKDEGMTVDEIVKNSGLTRDYVEKLLLINDLTPYCLRALDEGEINVSHAAALTRVKDPVRQETILGQLLLYHWPVKELERYIREVEDMVRQQPPPQTPAEPQPVPMVRCSFCGESYEPGKIANPNTCQYCAAIMLTAIREGERVPAPGTNTNDNTIPQDKIE